MEQDIKNIQKLILFDGHCHLCNGFVDALISRDKKHRFYFAPLQGSTASKYISASQVEKLDSVILWEQSITYERSTAILKILTGLGGVYKLFAVGWLVPTFLRDGIYNFIAQHRYLWFGRREFCRFPTPEEKNYLLP